MAFLTKEEIPEFIDYLKRAGKNETAELLSLCLSKADGEPYYCPDDEFYVIKHGGKVKAFRFPKKTKTVKTIVKALKEGKPIEDYFEEVSGDFARDVYLTAKLSELLKVKDISVFEDSSPVSRALVKAYTQFHPRKPHKAAIGFLSKRIFEAVYRLHNKGIAILKVSKEGQENRYEVVVVEGDKVQKRTYTIPVGRNLKEFAISLANLPYQSDYGLQNLLRQEIPFIIAELLGKGDE